jgi:hypothetical protein
MAVKKSEAGGALEPMLTGDVLRSAFRRRRDENEYLKIPPQDEAKSIAAGWSIHKKAQASFWMKRQKPSEALLEDRIVCSTRWVIRV